MGCAIGLGLLLAASAADAGAGQAVEPPSDHGEDQMFGGPASSGSALAVDGGAPASSDDAAPRPTEDQLFGDTEASAEGHSVAHDASLSAPDLPPNNPLTVGGLLYLRSQVSASEHQPPDQWLLSAPFLLDTYLDARPNDRVRAFVLVRTLYDPTYDPSAPNQLGLTFPSVPNPDLLIDQMWVKFDIDHEVFVTAGRQHVKWGTAHFWFPNDLLNPVKLQPLAVFDQRTGVTMLKANVPVEVAHLNVTGMALFEGLQQANQFGKVGGAGRVEYVLDTAEFGIDMVSSQGQHNRFGGDVSFGLLDFDFYAEGALTDGRDNPLWQETTAPNLAQGNPGAYQLMAPAGYQPQVAAGVNYGLRYGNNRVLTFGGEYFYNGLGYSNPSIYPWLLFNNDFTFFYVGQHYAGVYVLADKPGPWYNTTINLSTLSNLSDDTFISRIDLFQTVLTHLRVEAFADVHYGGNGEFHLGLNLPPLNFGSFGTPAINVPAASFDFGLALRVSL